MNQEPENNSLPIRIILEKCTGCCICIDSCPVNAIKEKGEKIAIDMDLCTLCAICVSICTEEAIVIEKEQKVVSKLDDYKGVWAFAEQKRGKVEPVAYELLGKGRDLADKLNVNLSAVLLGYHVEDEARKLIEKGADIESVSYGGMRPLHHACNTSKEAIIETIEANKYDFTENGEFPFREME